MVSCGLMKVKCEMKRWGNDISVNEDNKLIMLIGNKTQCHILIISYIAHMVHNANLVNFPHA